MNNLKKLKLITALTFRSSKKYTVQILYTLFTLTILSQFFPVKLPVYTQLSNSIGQYSDFITIFAYLSDFLILSTCIFILIKYKNSPAYISLLFIIYLLLRAEFSDIPEYTLLYIYPLILSTVLYETLGYSQVLHRLSTKPFIHLFTTLSVIQVGISIYQWYTQGSLGLYHVGEPHLSPSILGVAKLDLGAIKYIRPYGTFPHPNILALYLLTSFVIFSYYHLKHKHSAWNYIVLGILSYGILLTFSRGISIIFAISAIFMGLLHIYLQKPIKQLIFYAISTLGVAILFQIGLNSFQKTRYGFQDSAYSYRISYNHIATNIIKTNPIFGIGSGQVMFQMKHYSERYLEPWEIQPIHNYYLQTATELGITGLFFILTLFGNIFIKLTRLAFKPPNQHNPLTTFTLLLLLGSFLTLMLIDHYFYTLRQGQYLLWSFLGITMAYIKFHKKHSDSH